MSFLEQLTFEECEAIQEPRLEQQPEPREWCVPGAIYERPLRGVCCMYDAATGIWYEPQVALDGTQPEFVGSFPEAGRMHLSITYHEPMSHLCEYMLDGSLWPTPLASPGDIHPKPQFEENHKQQYTLRGMVKQQRTPKAKYREWRYEEEPEKNVRNHKASISPEWTEWLMGYPLGWTDLTDA